MVMVGARSLHNWVPADALQAKIKAKIFTLLGQIKCLMVEGIVGEFSPLRNNFVQVSRVVGFGN